MKKEKRQSKTKGKEINSFKCPECGATKVASNLCVSTDWSTGGEASSPWSYSLQRIHCANCDEYTPLILERNEIVLHMKKLKMNGCLNIGKH